MSADVDNIIALCATHHLAGSNPRMGANEPSWHSHPLLFAQWFEQKWPGRFKQLQKRAQIIQVVNWENRWISIKHG